VEKGASSGRNRKFRKSRRRRVGGKRKNGIERAGKLDGGRPGNREMRNLKAERGDRKRLRRCYLISKVRFIARSIEPILSLIDLSKSMQNSMPYDPNPLHREMDYLRQVD